MGFILRIHGVEAFVTTPGHKSYSEVLKFNCVKSVICEEGSPQDRYQYKTPLEVRNEVLQLEDVQEYPILANKRIEKYKEKWCV